MGFRQVADGDDRQCWRGCWVRSRQRMAVGLEELACALTKGTPAETALVMVGVKALGDNADDGGE